MLVILEGPDCAGKTTLAEKIVTRLAVKYPHQRTTLLHRGPPVSHPLDEYVAPLLGYRPGEEHIVCDRWHWGEVVYPAVLNRPTKMTPWLFEYVEQFLRMRGAVTVHVTAEPKVLLDRLARRGDDLIDAVRLADAAYRFHVVSNRSITGYAPSGYDVDDIIANAYGRERVAKGVPYVTAVGSPRPTVLLVGDVRACTGWDCAHARRHSKLGTAFMPYPATSGDYLMKALDFADIPTLGPYAIANACDVDDIVKMLNDTQPKSIIALGVKASSKLCRLRVGHAAVPHPQYVRRFHYAAAAEYGRLIYDVVGTERNELKWRSTPSRVSMLTHT